MVAGHARRPAASAAGLPVVVSPRAAEVANLIAGRRRKSIVGPY